MSSSSTPRQPFARRIAKAALLLAAGAAPVAGAAGQAAAAGSEQPLAAPLAGLQGLESAGVEQTLDNVTTAANGVVNEIGGEAVKAVMPVAGPMARDLAADTGRTAATTLRDVVGTPEEARTASTELGGAAATAALPDTQDFSLLRSPL
ncbi:ATP-binding protein [Streptomyces sp. NPDC049881]|uniref:ATP-binding protein n=1 Tax=unclassified Streptomyces TaxID=2593676 RepID=UPI00341B86C7